MIKNKFQSNEKWAEGFSDCCNALIKMMNADVNLLVCSADISLLVCSECNQICCMACDQDENDF